jgi:putative ABC transport system ATP-binding protein
VVAERQDYGRNRNILMQETLIQIRELNKEFNLGHTTVYACKDINLDIYKGEYISIMGPSGSGKSTLFNMVGGLDLPTSGHVTVAAVDLTRLSSRELAYFRSNHIGYIFQTFNLIPAYNAVDNVAMPLIFSGVPYEESTEIAKEVLDRVGLEHRLHHRPDELSGGQQQRVAIARALANKPSIILADEPTGNLDLHTGEEIIALLSQLSKEDGATVISATHDHKMLAASDRILWIRDGKVDRIQLRSELDIKVGVVE